MDNMININNTKANTLEFEMTIEGANASDVDCHFVISAKDQDFRFKAIKEDDNHWKVTIPAMPYLERTTYNCYTEVVTEGQYFKPMDGNVNVVGSADIYISTPANKTVESDIKKKKVAIKEDKKREEKRKNQSWRQQEKSIEQIAEELTKNAKKEVLTEKKSVLKPSDTDSKVKRAIKESAVAANEARKEKVKQQQEKKAEDVKPVVEAKEPEIDPRTAKVRAILEESGIKPKKKKEKVSFVYTQTRH